MAASLADKLAEIRQERDNFIAASRREAQVVTEELRKETHAMKQDIIQQALDTQRITQELQTSFSQQFHQLQTDFRSLSETLNQHSVTIDQQFVDLQTSLQLSIAKQIGDFMQSQQVNADEKHRQRRSRKNGDRSRSRDSFTTVGSESKDDERKKDPKDRKSKKASGSAA